MTSLTFFKNSNGSHGIVGWTTGFWRASYGFNTNHLPIYFLLQWYDFELWGLFFCTLRTILFRRFLVGAFWFEKADFCRYFFLFIILILFQITTNFLLFSLIVFPAFYFKACKCSLWQAQASTRKHQKVPSTVLRQIFDGKLLHPLLDKIFRYQTISETLNGCPTNFFDTVRQKILDEKSWYPVSHTSSISETFRSIKRPPREFYFGDKKFATCSCDTPSVVRHNFCTRPVANARNTWKGSFTIFSALWD